MTERVTLRVRARRNRGGSILEWHPDDAEQAEELFEMPKQVIIECYDLISRSHVADGDVVVTFEVWPRSGYIEDIDVDDRYEYPPTISVMDARENIRRQAGGVGA